MPESGSGRDHVTAPSLIDLMRLRLVIPGGLLSRRVRFRLANRGYSARMRMPVQASIRLDRNTTLTRGLTLRAHPSALPFDFRYHLRLPLSAASITKCLK